MINTKQIITSFTTILIILLSACIKLDYKDNDSIIQTKIDKLDLVSKLANGVTIWSVKSDNAQYQNNQKEIYAESPFAYLYKRGNKEYRISSNKLIVIDDGLIMKMIGNIQIENILDKNLRITTNLLDWDTETSIITLEGETNIYLYDKANKTKNQEAFINILLKEAVWDIQNGNLSSDNQVKAFVKDYTIQSKNLIKLQSNSLTGNLNKRYFDLNQCDVKNSGETLTTKAAVCTVDARSLLTINTQNDVNSKVKSHTNNYKIYFSSDPDDKINTIIKF